MLKRKWFAKDTFARREKLVSGVDVTRDGFEEYLRTELGLQVRAMPPFQRVRYDVQCESMRTGHVYGIFFDRCSLLAAPEVVLSQCEPAADDLRRHRAGRGRVPGRSRGYAQDGFADQ